MRISAVCILLMAGTTTAAPALANWFDVFTGAGEGHIRQIGSAVTPTPDDLRAIGDSDLGKGKSYRFDPKDGHYHEVKPAADTKPSDAPPMRAPIPEIDLPAGGTPAQ